MPDLNTIAEFMRAIRAGKAGDVEAMLIAHPALVDAHAEDGISAVLTALYNQRPFIAKMLVDGGARLDIFGAAAAGQVQRLRKLLERQPDLANSFAADGFQPLGLASFFGQTEAVRLLLDYRAEVNSPSRNAMHVMPLHSAAAGGHLEIVRLLLEHGADANAVQADEYTPLHEAAQNGQIEMIELLLKFGAAPNPRAKGGKTPLDLAKDAGKTAAVELLLQHGAE